MTKKTGFALMPLAVVVAGNLSSFEYRMLSLVAAKAYRRPVTLSYAEIAAAFKCSIRKVMRATAGLSAKKFIVREQRHNYPNVYALNPDIFAIAARPTFGDPCLKCGKPTRKLGPAGWCTFCVRLVNSDRKPAAKAIA